MRLIGLVGGKVLSPSGKLIEGTLLLQGEKIVGIESIGEIAAYDGIETIDVSGCIVSPGFIDTHVHGGGGYNFMEGTKDALCAIARHMASSGVTSCLATTTSAPHASLLSAINNIVSAMNGPVVDKVDWLGVHLEGPYINPKARGVHIESHIRNATSSELEEILDAAGSALRVVTLAPEMPFGMEAVRFLSAHGVNVSIGHTTVSYDEATAAIRNGAIRGTHTFNAMPPIHHRMPGPITALFEAPKTGLEFIVDGHHVHPSIIAMTHRQIGWERIILVTDCTDVAGQGDGEFTRWEGTRVVVKEGQSRTLSGSLAGSTLSMNAGVRNLVRLVGLSVEEALRIASENPAKSIGVFDRKGSFHPGKDADVVVLNNDLSVALTISMGQITYDARQQEEAFAWNVK